MAGFSILREMTSRASGLFTAALCPLTARVLSLSSSKKDDVCARVGSGVTPGNTMFSHTEVVIFARWIMQSVSRLQLSFFPT